VIALVPTSTRSGSRGHERAARRRAAGRLPGDAAALHVATMFGGLRDTPPGGGPGDPGSYENLDEAGALLGPVLAPEAGGDRQSGAGAPNPLREAWYGGSGAHNRARGREPEPAPPRARPGRCGPDARAALARARARERVGRCDARRRAPHGAEKNGHWPSASPARCDRTTRTPSWSSICARPSRIAVAVRERMSAGCDDLEPRRGTARTKKENWCDRLPRGLAAVGAAVHGSTPPARGTSPVDPQQPVSRS